MDLEEELKKVKRELFGKKSDQVITAKDWNAYRTEARRALLEGIQEDRMIHALTYAQSLYSFIG